MAYTYPNPKNVNTNLLGNGAFVEKVNQGSTDPVNFIPNTNERAEQLQMTHTAYPPNRFIASPNGSTWPVVDINNQHFRNPIGDGSQYDDISTP